MFCSDAGAKSVLVPGIAIFALACVLVFQMSSVVRAADTTVGAAICGTGAAATLTITDPPSDSVVDQPTVVVSGEVANATQIDISIDGDYDSTLPLSPGETNYQTSVQLTTGTHTIKLEANDVCQMQDATASVVVTYQARTTPGSGNETPTQVGEGVNVGGQPIENNSQPIDAESWPVVGPIINLGRDLVRGLDFEIGNQPGSLWRSMLRFSFIVIGLAVALLGNAAITAWGWAKQPLSIRQQRGIRLFGILLVLVAFLV